MKEEGREEGKEGRRKRRNEGRKGRKGRKGRRELISKILYWPVKINYNVRLLL